MSIMGKAYAPTAGRHAINRVIESDHPVLLAASHDKDRELATDSNSEFPWELIVIVDKRTVYSYINKSTTMYTPRPM